MKLVLLFLIVINIDALALNGVKSNGHLGHVGKSNFPSFDSKPLILKEVTDNASNGPYCNSLIAYYVGTLKNKKDPTKTYDVEFQLKLWTDEKNKIHVYVDKWNERYSRSDNFELDYYYDANRDWCEIYDDECISPFAKKDDTSFRLDLNTVDGNYFHLLNFNNFNNSFGLLNSKGQCTKHQLDGLNDENVPDLEELSFCVCCDDYNPSKLLACPDDTWAHERTTKSPVTKRPDTQTCQSIIAYYNGTFKNVENPPSWHTIEAQLQFKLNSSLANKKVYFQLTNWKTDDKEVMLEELFDNSHVQYCAAGSVCAIDFPASPTLNIIGFTTGEHNIDLLDFPSFTDKFTLVNTVGKCTNYQPLHSPEDGWAADPSLYSYCVCCDEYNPDPSLKCPRNPWQ